MILGVIFSITGIGLLIALMFNMAIYALPLFAAVSAGRLAFAGGAGWLGAIVAGVLARVLTLGLGQLVLAAVKSDTVRLAIALVFAPPAGFAGYHVVLGLSRIGGAHGVWQTLFAVVGALVIAGAALARLTTPLVPSAEGSRTSRGCLTEHLDSAEELSLPARLQSSVLSTLPEDLGSSASPCGPGSSAALEPACAVSPLTGSIPDATRAQAPRPGVPDRTRVGRFGRLQARLTRRGGNLASATHDEVDAERGSSVVSGACPPDAPDVLPAHHGEISERRQPT